MPDSKDNRLTATGEPRAPGLPRTPGPRANLSEQQILFCHHFIKEFNATQSAVAAGYGNGDLNQCSNSGWKQLQKPLVKQKIADLLRAQHKRTGIDADWLLNRLVDEAEADLADLYDDENRMLPVKEWPLIWRQGLVAAVEQVEGEEVTVAKVKIADRLQRLNLIGRHVDVRAFEETVKVEAGDSLVAYMEAAAERVRERERLTIHGEIEDAEVVNG